MNILDGLEAAARFRGDHPAIVFEERALTYRELRAAVNNLAVGLAGAGIRAGERVCLFLPNVPELPIAYYALMQLGAVAVSVNIMSKPDELRHIVQDSEAVAILTLADHASTIPPRAEIPSVRSIFTDAGAADGGVISFAAMIRRAAAPLPAADVGRDTPAAILYTSGTTGKCKGAVLSHGNVVSNVHSTRHATGMRPDDVMICFLPLFHCFGQNFIMNATLYSGATLLLQRRFVLDQALAAVRHHRVTMFFGVPTIYIALFGSAEATEALRGVRYYFSAAAILPVDVERAWHELTGLHIHEGYGLTETSPFASYNHAFAWRQGSIGSPIDNVEMRVVDEQDRPLADGEVGEICIKGPNVMLGYFNRPADTEAAVVEGWFHSGDIGCRDVDGYYYIVDRVKDMINAAGFKIWPREVEEVLFRHSKVKECAVLGVPDDHLGEAVKAFVVLKEGEQASADEIVAYCREHLSNYKVPRYVELVQTIPKGATGKILKKDMRRAP
jgi:long-chain acyl-CoA synthetase